MIVRFRDKVYEVVNANRYAITEEELTILLMESQWSCNSASVDMANYHVQGCTHTGRKIWLTVFECAGMSNQIFIGSIKNVKPTIHEVNRLDKIKKKVEATKVGNIVNESTSILMNYSELNWLINEAEKNHITNKQSILYGPIENSRGIPKHLLEQVLDQGEYKKHPNKEIWELGGIRITKINGKVYVSDLEYLKNPDKDIIVHFDLNQYRVVENRSKLSPYEIGHVMANGVRMDYPGFKYTTIIGATENGKMVWMALYQRRKTLTVYSTTHHDFPAVRANAEMKMRDAIKSEWTTERHKEWKSLKFWQKLTKIFS